MSTPIPYPRPGDFGLSPGGGLAMRIVRWGTGVPRFKWGRFIRTPAKYGHCVVAVSEPWLSADGRVLVEIMEATPNDGVRQAVVDVKRFDWSTDGPLTPQLTGAVRAGIVESVKTMEGKKYDWPNIIKFFARWAKPTFAGDYEKDYADGETICSELAVWAYRENKVTGLLDRNAPGSIAPNSMAAFLGPYRPRVG